LSTPSQSWNRYSYADGNPLRFVDPDGREAVAIIVGPSPFERNPKGAFGHSALFVRSGQRTAGVSYGGAHDLSKGVKPLTDGYRAEGRTVTLYVLKTTPEQDQKMVDFLTRNHTGAVKPDSFLADAMVVQNCTTAVCNTLSAGGVLKPGETADGALSLVHSPSELQESLESGELSDDVSVVITLDPLQSTPSDELDTDEKVR
jgi:hypothetical protein